MEETPCIPVRKKEGFERTRCLKSSGPFLPSKWKQTVHPKPRHAHTELHRGTSYRVLGLILTISDFINKDN